MRSLILLSVLAATAATGAERKLFVSSFDRLRVDGPFQVAVATGRSPGGSVSGDARALDAVEVRQDGDTIVVRARSATERRVERGATGPVRVTLSTPALTAAYLTGSGAIAVAGMKGDRADLSIAGTGAIAVAGANVTELTATTIGSGRITLAGRTSRVRIVVNGAGGVAADALDAGEVTVRLDGPGEVTARARFTADVTNTGLGRVTIAGGAKCVVKSVNAGSVVCGTATP